MTSTRDEIVLIGPVGAGKSTVGKLCAQRLGVPTVAMDDLRWSYYAELGYSSQEADRRLKQGGFRAKYEYWKPFEIHALERLLQDQRNCVLHLGAGHSVYEDPALLTRAQRALGPFSNVVLLLPSADPELSIRILAERTQIATEDDWDFNAHFVRHPSNGLLANHVIFTEDRVPEQTATEVLSVTRALRSEAVRDSVAKDM